MRHPLSLSVSMFIALMAVDALGQPMRSRSIPFEHVYSNGPQLGFNRVSQGRVVDDKIVQEDYGHDLRTLFKEAGRGPSNAFLVDADSIKDAMRGSLRVMVGGAAADKAVKSVAVRSGEYWLVAFLGCGHSGPLRWEVKEIRVDKWRVRLTYRVPKEGWATADVHRHIFWAPLGKLPAGAYSVELFDSGSDAITMKRRVLIDP